MSKDDSPTDSGTQETNSAGCENCGYTHLETFINTPAQKLLYCPDCQLYQKGNLPAPALYEDSYHSGYEQRRKNKTTTAMIRLAALTKYIDVKVPRMLDIGCSIGATVAAGTKLGWQASGVDISRAAVDYCRDQHGQDCYKIDGTELPFEDNTFDVVTNWHVIEHVTDVNATLKEWYRVVKPGGIMVLETPDSQCFKARRLGAKYAKFWPVGHLYTFNRKNMCSLLGKQGFEILPSRILGKLSALPPHLTAYAAAYRSWRKMYRTFGMCKSIEVCCRKPMTTTQAAVAKRAA